MDFEPQFKSNIETLIKSNGTWFEKNLNVKQKIITLNEIWNLKKVTHCNFNHCHGLSIQLTRISIISQTIEYLSIDNSDNVRNLTQLIYYTPKLQRLNWNLKYSSGNEPSLISMPPIISLEFRCCITNDRLKTILQHMPNLCYLKLNLINIYLNGYEWENLFVLNLPKIKNFQFQMNLKFSEINIEEQINNILDLFRSIIYTLPYAFNHIFYLNQYSSKSTCPNEHDYWSYDNVNIFEYINGNNMFINDFINFPIHLNYIRELDIALPINNYFWSIISSWNQLISLNIIINEDDGNVYFQLQKLFDQTPCLYSLKFSNWNDLNMILFQKLKSKSIRRLHFTELRASYRQFFNRNECSALINSILGKQCEVLIVSVNNQTLAIDIAENMIKLRSLIIKCQTNKPSRLNFPSRNNIFVQWK
ncbi:unnamed protein product [Rotaria sp. Silwood2]|nr:unnamed protein product [Rotaria sp. Silwood2]